MTNPPTAAGEQQERARRRWQRRRDREHLRQLDDPHRAEHRQRGARAQRQRRGRRRGGRGLFRRTEEAHCLLC